MKRIALTCLHFFVALLCVAQTEVTTQEAKSLYQTTGKQWVSIHDPSVVYEPASGRYYIFGSHKAGAWTTDLQNWTQANPTWKVGSSSNASNSTAFVTPAVKKVKKGGAEVDFPQFNAMEWSARTDADYNINGNMWAPDVIWNPVMKKWCMYLSINGDSWYSSIILLTANQITGPYEYQGPVVICGFRDSSHSYKGTDLELVLGTQSSLPSRYNVGSGWGRRWPHTIDPSAFYDEQGKLWLVYGSWSGGIWMLELDEETGLRDYDVVYPSTNGSTDGVTSDPYYGTKIAGGYYVSGEGPYIERIGNYYFLFVSYGGFDPNGGYEMRVFRSDKPNGPYKDGGNRSAIFTSYVKNYGTGTETRGEKIMGSYNKWGFQTVGECAQGHNSVVTTTDGRSFLVYHTKFNNGTAGHQVRVHQLFLNEEGWPVAAPFEYNGEAIDNSTITQTPQLTKEQIAGTYQVMIHKYKMDYANYEEVTPVELTLTPDGSVIGSLTGSSNGTWTLKDGTAYITITMNGTTYRGVVIEEQMDSRTLHAVSFTATTRTGINIWGYKFHPRYAVAWQVINQKAPVSNGLKVMRNYDLYGIMGLHDPNVKVQWTSSLPAIISDYGRYNPVGLADDTPVTLTARVSSADYYWEQAFDVKAMSEVNALSTADWQTGMLAHYGFDDGQLANSLNPEQQARLLTTGSAAYMPELNATEALRNGKVVQLRQGVGNNSGMQGYVSMPNPLFGLSLDQGFTVSFYVKRSDANLWDALCGFQNEGARFYVTGNLYAGYNNGAGSWLDQNHPEQVKPTDLGPDNWHLLTIVCKRTATANTGGITMFVDGFQKRDDVFNGALADGTTLNTKNAFDYNLIVDHVASCPEFWLGNGSFWSTPAAFFDDVMIHDHALTASQVMALRQMTDRAHQLSAPLAIDSPELPSLTADLSSPTVPLYDLQGRRLTSAQPKKGIYVVGGRKVIVR